MADIAFRGGRIPFVELLADRPPELIELILGPRPPLGAIRFRPFQILKQGEPIGAAAP